MNCDFKTAFIAYMHCFFHELIVKFVDIPISQQTFSRLILFLVAFNLNFNLKFTVISHLFQIFFLFETLRLVL